MAHKPSDMENDSQHRSLANLTYDSKKSTNTSTINADLYPSEHEKLTPNVVIETTKLLNELKEKTIHYSYKPETLKTNAIIDLKNELSEEKELSSQSFELLKLLIQCEEQIKNVTNLSNLLDLRSHFGHLKILYPVEYEKYHLCDNAVSVLCSFLQQYFTSNPIVLNDHDQALENLFFEWKDILKCCSISLTTDDSSSGKLDMDYYDFLVRSTFIPAVEKAIHELDPDQANHLINFVNKWKTCVGENVVGYTVDQVILPKLITQINVLYAKSDSKSANELIDRWEPFMKNRLTSLYQQSKEK